MAVFYSNPPSFLLVAPQTADADNDSDDSSDTSTASDSSASSEECAEYTMCWPWTEVKLEDPPAKPRKLARYTVSPGIFSLLFIYSLYSTLHPLPFAVTTNANLAMDLPAAGNVCDANGFVSTTIAAEEENKEEKKDSFTYLPRHEGDPHPPILGREVGHRYVVPTATFVHTTHYSTHYAVPSFIPVPQYAYVQPQYPQLAYPTGYQYAYQYPYNYSAPSLPAGTHVYLPQQHVAAVAPSNYVVTDNIKTHEDHQKAKKDTKGKKKKKSKSKHTAHEHAWYGRTAAEVFEDEIKTAGKDGVYGPRDIAPRDPKPSDMFWVMPYEPGERAKLVTYYEIMDVHKPGQWRQGPDGYLRWHKERPKEDRESSSESSASEWEN